jgi:alpha-mannosidase
MTIVHRQRRRHRAAVGTGLVVACCSLVAVPGAGAQTVPLDVAWAPVPGYAQTVRGEELTYHSPIPTVNKSLLVRSLDRAYDIEWESATLPSAGAADTVEFVLMIGIDVNEEPRRFDLYVNGDSVLALRNPVDTGPGVIEWEGRAGVRATFRVTEIDKYGDAMGYLFLRLPRSLLKGSARARFRVAGETAGARTWFMVFTESIAPRIEARNAPALLRADSGATQSLRVDVLHLGEAAPIRLRTPVAELDTSVALGLNRFEVAVPKAVTPATVRLAFAIGGTQGELEAEVAPVRAMDLYLIHHTHLDIGYTHVQDEVERLQWAHLDSALAYGAASAGNPDGARFVWHPEGLWAVESYLETRTTAERERLLDGIRRGWIALDGMYANLLTGLATEEALLQSLEPARRMADLTGVPIETAMLSDIPGFSWGLVPVLARSGIRYLTIGPNFGHRIGRFMDAWGDRPFYWESPAGDERVLTWVSSGGYAWFHSGLGYATISRRFDEENIFKYLAQLADAEYPYGIAALRYNIGSDNGPPDPGLAEAVRAWNAKYVSPRILIGSTRELFHAFEARYAEQLPVYRGDLTGHWEDGAGSSARETAATRRVAESLVQTGALAAMLGLPLPSEDVRRAWREVTLFYEHTWGSWNSISEPESAFTRAQWARKRAFADSATALARELRRAVLDSRSGQYAPQRIVEVYNTSSWPRTDLVELDARASAAGDVVVNEDGQPVASQRLASGALAFLARDVPAYGSRRYRVTAGTAPARRGPAAPPPHNAIVTDDLRLEVDPSRGTITSLVDRTSGRELAAAGQGGLNAYVYVAGRSPDDTSGAGDVQVTRVDRGPLVHTIRVRSSGAGVRRLDSEIRVVAGLRRVEIVNRLEKQLVYAPEAVLYRFPFGLERPRVRVSVPWGSYEVDEGQLPGACRNYLTAERWVDLADERGGVTVVAVDAPLFQLGEVRTDPIVAGWVEHLEPSGTFLSYVMNNYWETNYRAAQDGAHEFRYALGLHGGADMAAVDRWAREVAQPFIVAVAPLDTPRREPPVSVEAARSVVTRFEMMPDGASYLVRIFNPGDRADSVTVRGRAGAQVGWSDAWGQEVAPAALPLVLAPLEAVTLRIEDPRDGRP